MKLVTLQRADDKGDVSINPDSVSDIRVDPDGHVVVRMTNGASYRLESTSLDDTIAALQPANA